MARPREPINLLLAKGKKHLTNEEIKNRQKSEINLDDYRNVEPPKFLNSKQKKTFKEIARILVDINVMSELDEDALARYLVAHENYIRFTKLLDKTYKDMNDKKNKDDIKLQIKLAEDLDKYVYYQDKFFKQSRVAASDMGLTVTSRARIVLPQGNAPPEKGNKFMKFFDAG